MATEGGLAGWIVFEKPRRTEGDGTVVEGIEMTHIATRAAAHAKGEQYHPAVFERAFNPRTKQFEMRLAFLEGNPNKVVSGGVDMTATGTPTHIYATIRLMKKMGMGFGEAQRLKMSGIENLEMILALAVAERDGKPLTPETLMAMKSLEYGAAAMTQAGKTIVPGSIELSGGERSPISRLLRFLERTHPERKQLHEEMLARNQFNRDTVMLMGFDITAELIAAPQLGTGGR